MVVGWITRGLLRRHFERSRAAFVSVTMTSNQSMRGSESDGPRVPSQSLMCVCVCVCFLFVIQSETKSENTRDNSPSSHLLRQFGSIPGQDKQTNNNSVAVEVFSIGPDYVGPGRESVPKTVDPVMMSGRRSPVKWRMQGRPTGGVPSRKKRSITDGRPPPSSPPLSLSPD